MKHKKSLKLVLIALSGLMVFTGCKTTEQVTQFISATTKKANHHISEMIQNLMPEMSASKKEALIAQLTNSDPDQRRAGILTITHGKPSRWKVTPELLSVLVINDQDQLVQTIAVERLVAIAPNETTVKLLGDTIKASSKSVQLVCVIGIGEIYSPMSMTILLEQLTNNEHKSVRRVAAKALGFYHNKRAVNNLITALSDDAFEVHYHARLALIDISGQDFSYDEDLWKKWVLQHGDTVFND